MINTMTYRLISLSGLIHDYQGEAKEYIPMPTVGFYDTTDAEDAHRLDVAMREHRKFESQCVLVEDQERILWLLRTAVDSESIHSDPKSIIEAVKSKIQDRTLYTVEAPEMERVEQMKRKTDKEWFTATHALINVENQEDFEYRTVMRFKEVETIKITLANGTKFEVEAKESQEVNQTVYWNEAIEILNKNQGLSELFSKFTLTRKP